MLNRRGSISCKTEYPSILTYLRKRCSSLWSLGLIVASNKGTKMFSNIFPKLGRIFFVLNISLKGKKYTKLWLFFNHLLFFISFHISFHFCLYSKASVLPGLRNPKFNVRAGIASVLCFLHCLAFCFIQTLQKFLSAPKIVQVSSGKCRLKNNDPFLYSNTSTKRRDRESPLMTVCSLVLNSKWK